MLGEIMKSTVPRPAIQKLATARSVGAIYLWFIIGDSSTHFAQYKMCEGVGEAKFASANGMSG